MQLSERRVVITGVGMVTPLGNNSETTWRALLDGKSGISKIDQFDASTFKTQFAGQVKNLAIEPIISAKSARSMDLFIQYGIIAAVEAINSAGLINANHDPNRIGMAIGSGIGGIRTIESSHSHYLNQGPKKISPFFVPSIIINMIAGHISIKYGFTGPSIAVSTACSTGAHNIGLAVNMIRRSEADVMITGGSEMATTPLTVGAFNSARALSTNNEFPTKASRPWDKNRDGFVLGDGAGILVLEDYESAKKRKAKIWGEIVGFGMSSDAFHITAPPQDGHGAARAMQNALADAKLNPDDIDYVNAHGTSTIAGDVAETVAIKDVFGNYAAKLPISSTKSMMGHLLGAAGAVEAIICLLAMQQEIIPPTINLDEADDSCDLDYVSDGARKKSLTAIMSNSFGFGGTNACLVFKKI